MNIIFGDTAKDLPDGYTILELDTFRLINENRTETAYCLVENLNLSEFSTLDAYKKIHQDLMRCYRERQWSYCEQAIEGLMGRWGGDLDSFYVELLSRVLNYKDHEPALDWDGTRIKI